MSNIYFVDTSQTYDGDGTLSTGAASDGAAGAANSLWAIRTGSHSYVTLAAGDTVYVRTYDGSANCGETITSTNADSVGAGTIGNPTTYIFDDGTKWAGDSGQFVLSTNGSEFNISFGYYTNVYAGDASDRRFKLNFTHTAISGTHPKFFFAHGISEGCHFESTGGVMLTTIAVTTAGCHITVKDLYWKAGNSWYSTSYFPFMKGTYGMSLLLINPVFDVSLCTSNAALMCLSRSGQSESCRVVGGSVENGYEGLELLYLTPTNVNQHNILIEGFNYGALVVPFDFDTVSTFSLANMGNSTQLISCGQTYNYAANIGGCLLNYTPGDLYPTKTATLPDAAGTLWSIRVYVKGSLQDKQVTLPKIEKFYSQPAAGNKTFTVEVAIQTTLSADTSNLSLLVQYVDDTTGELRMVNGRDNVGVALTSSSGWSATSYGSDAFTAYKVSVEMLAGDTIKQYTPIKAFLVCGIERVNDNDSFFYNPDLDIT